MTEAPTILWEGQSGEKYKYYIYRLDATHNAVPANYIFAKETRPSFWKPIYIGETEDISERFDYHHKIDCIRREGATPIYTHKSSEDKKVRCAEESDLVSKCKPPCND